MKRIGLAALLLVFLVVQAGAGEIEAEQFQREGKLREAFDAYLAAFRVSLGDSSKSAELRMKIIALALKLNPLPEIPEVARKHAAFAVAALDEKSDSGMKDATKEFLKATQLAPWQRFDLRPKVPRSDLESAHEKGAGKRYCSSRSD